VSNLGGEEAGEIQREQRTGERIDPDHWCYQWFVRRYRQAE
jgi:hypothetical protein